MWGYERGCAVSAIMEPRASECVRAKIQTPVVRSFCRERRRASLAALGRKRC